MIMLAGLSFLRRNVLPAINTKIVFEVNLFIFHVGVLLYVFKISYRISIRRL